MARYGEVFKDRAVVRLLPPESAAITQVSQELGVSVATLDRWLADGYRGHRVCERRSQIAGCPVAA